MGEPVYVRRGWYVAALGEELSDGLVECRVLDEPLVLYRSADGRPVCLENRCVHRGFPLSRSRPVGDWIECGYHGFTYDAGGACVRIPSQAHIPPRARVRAYPVVEHGGFAWVWLEDPAGADPGLLPPLPWLDDPRFTVIRGVLEVNSPYVPMIENLLDLTHFTYLHPETLGSQAICQAPISVQVEGDVVRARRAMLRVAMPPNAREAKSLRDPIDWHQLTEFRPPTWVRIETIQCSADQPEERTTTEVLNATTPVARDRLRYFWAFAADYPIDPAAKKVWLEQLLFAQDVAALEAIQAVNGDRIDAFQVNAAADEASIRARRIITRLAEAEAP